MEKQGEVRPGSAGACWWRKKFVNGRLSIGLWLRLGMPLICPNLQGDALVDKEVIDAFYRFYSWVV